MAVKSEFRYAVILLSEEFIQPRKIAGALASIKKVPWQDLMPAAKRCWGIPADDLSQEEAGEFVVGLDKAGLEALAVPSNLIEDLPEYRRVARLDWEADGFRVPLREEGTKIRAGDSEDEGEPERIIWDRIQLIAAIGYQQEEADNPASRSAGAKGGRMPRSGRKSSENGDVVFFLDLIVKDPVLRLRIDAQNFDFSFLRDRMQYTVLSNFRWLVAETTDRAPGAMRTRGTTVLVRERPFREMGYESIEDLERECRWLLTLSALQLR